jgi:hypothetical protein
MMKSSMPAACLIAVVALGIPAADADEPIARLKSTLAQPFDFNQPRTAGTVCFHMTTTWIDFRPDGARGDAETYSVKLMCVSPKNAAQAGLQYTCKRFDYTGPDGARVSIPALEGWSYTFKETDSGIDERGQVFGIDHAKFENLTDSAGSPLEPSRAYLIYNTFIDFHGFCDLFARPTAEGRGIQHLTRIGQKIVHDAANSKAPTNLVGNIKEGSHFKNGEITMELKGLSIVNDAPCAILEVDSGKSSFRMLMEPMPGMRVDTVGSSHYFGNLYVDLASRWTRKVELREWVASRTTVPMPGGAEPTVIDSIKERQTLIRSVSKKAFESDCTRPVRAGPVILTRK